MAGAVADFPEGIIGPNVTADGAIAAEADYSCAMFDPVDTRDPVAVEAAVRSTQAALFPDADPTLVPRAFAWARQCFRGEYEDYLPIDVGYHDFEHTLQGALCLVRLLHGRHRAGAKPALTPHAFELGILAVLMHDTGYLKHDDDRAGTGAKYTPIHEGRSALFAEAFLVPKGISATDVRAVQNMINCTGLNTDLASIPFQSELERTVGYSLGTADLLGQMAAADYVEKLPLLYAEFVEAAPNAAGASARMYAFASAADLMRRTPAFWDNYVRPKLDREFSGLYTFLNDPWPDGPNPYLRRIEANLARLRALSAVPSA
jgi:hypothetical protein